MNFRPASLVDYARLFPGRPERIFRRAAMQILAGPAWALERDGQPVLIAGLWPFANSVLEAWLMLPSGAARPGHAALRFLLARSATVFPDHIIICRVDDGNPAGQKMAILAGFEPLDEHLPGTTKRTWLRRSLLPID